jgi:hypothetical protein
MSFQWFSRCAMCPRGVLRAIFVEVEASDAGFKMALLFPCKGSKGWRV